MTTAQNAFVLLGVNAFADDAAVGKAFRAQAIVHHPDKGGSPLAIALLQKYSWYSQDTVFFSRK